MNPNESTVAARAGEEFRDDTRLLKPATAGNVRKLLPPEELAQLTRLDPLRSTWAIVQTLGLLALHRALAGRGVLAGAEVRAPGDTFGRVFADRVSAAAATQRG